MKLFTSKVERMYAAQWNGEDDDPLVNALRSAGWKVVFQQPEAPRTTNWNWKEDVEEEIDTPGRMMILGNYRGQVWHLDAGQWVSYTEGRGTLTTWSISDIEDSWEGQDETFTIPTPEQLNQIRNADRANDNVEFAPAEA